MSDAGCCDAAVVSVDGCGLGLNGLDATWGRPSSPSVTQPPITIRTTAPTRPTPFVMTHLTQVVLPDTPSKAANRNDCPHPCPDDFCTEDCWSRKALTWE